MTRDDFEEIRHAVARFKVDLDERGFSPANPGAAQAVIDSLTGSGIISRENLSSALAAIERRSQNRAAEVAMASEAN